MNAPRFRFALLTTTTLLTSLPALAGLLGAGGCSGADSTTPSAPPPSSTVLEAHIGPEGGTLEGAPGTIFEGVRLVIPKGALATDEDVTIRPTFDPTALPPLAHRIGQQFSIEPANVMLAVPATLTLPFDPSLLLNAVEEPDHIKVWVRDSAGWLLREQEASVGATVEIALNAFTPAAAAGVKTLVKPSICSTTPAICAPVTSSADLACSGICVTSLPNPPDQNSSLLVRNPVEQGNLYSMEYWPDLTIHRYAIPAGTVATTEPLTGGVTIPVARNLVTDSDGSVWVGTGPNGNTQFRFGNVPVRRDFDAQGQGGVMLGNGNLLLANVAQNTSLSVTERVGGVFGARIPLPVNLPPASPLLVRRLIANPLVTDGYWSLVNTVANAFILQGEIALRRVSASTQVVPPIVTTSSQAAAFLAVAPDGSIAYETIDYMQTTTLVSIEKRTLRHRTYAGVDTELSGVPPVNDMAYDARGNLWMVSGGTPEVYILRPDQQTLVSVLLTPALQGTTDYQNAIANSIEIDGDNVGIVTVESGQLLRILDKS